MKDTALLPLQLDGLDELVEDLTVVRLSGRRPFRAVGSARRGRRCAPALPCRRMRRLVPRGMTQTRSRSRSAARLAAVQALYQQDMEGTPLPRLLQEFHDHRLGATIEDETYHDAERDFFDDIVTGADARRDEIDGLISARLAEGLDASSGSTGRCARSSAPALMS